MKISIWLLLVVSICVWVVFGAVLLQLYEPGWLIESTQAIKLPKNTAELGDSFGVLSAFMSPIALILALAAMLTQSKQQVDSNVIGAYSMRQQFLLMECERLESSIQNLKYSESYDEQLFRNMVNKRSRFLKEAQAIDEKISALLNRF
ncbi:hypothetical protein [Thiosocius teredinicola]|uniref:hypothetical protein n=1 Tax=Thiosocius teredinicola TaxID=1973002 RepID=UPI000F7916AB